MTSVVNARDLMIPVDVLISMGISMGIRGSGDHIAPISNVSNQMFHQYSVRIYRQYRTSVSHLSITSSHLFVVLAPIRCCSCLFVGLNCSWIEL